MDAPKLISAYDELLDYLIRIASPKDILAFKATDEAQAHADYLTAQNKSDSLTPEERDELNQLLEFDSLVSALKAKALAALNQS
jgi:hypothetical protein